jgi:small subunit ribosomal protein S16
MHDSQVLQRLRINMVVIRLARGGAKKAPFYQLVAADKRRARDSKFIEKLGYFNPIARGNAIALDIDQERVDYWLGQGAEPSERVAKLLKEFKKNGVVKASEPGKATQRKEQADKAEAQQAAAKAKKAEEAVKAEAAAPAEAEKADDAEKSAE